MVKCSVLPVMETETAAGLPCGTVFTASTTALPMDGRASMRSFSPVNCARSGADSIGAFVGG